VVKRIRWTSHALEAIAEREILQEEVERAIREPTARVPGHGHRVVLLRKYFDHLVRQQMLLCAVTEESVDEIVIVTVYKTSRIDRHLGERGS
jgi:hypothetical protein